MTAPTLATGTGQRPGRAEFKAAAGSFPTGVAVAATRYRDRLLAKTVSSFVSLSLDPLLVGVAVGRESPLVWAARVSGVLGVSVLRADQRALADRYALPAERRPDPSPAADGELAHAVRGGPLLTDCLSRLDCRVTGVVPAGDHALLVAEVVAVRTFEGAPLLHHAGRYRELAEPPRPGEPGRTPQAAPDPVPADAPAATAPEPAPDVPAADAESVPDARPQENAR